MSERELKVPVECASLESPHPVPTNNLMGKYHRIVADKTMKVSENLTDEYHLRVLDKTTKAFDGGEHYIDGHHYIDGGDHYFGEGHLITYLSSDNTERFSVLMQKNPNTGKDVPLSITNPEGRSDTFDLTTGDRAQAIWDVQHKNGKTHMVAMIDIRSGDVTTETGSFYDKSGHELTSFKYLFNPDGNATACYKADGLLRFSELENATNWQNVWHLKPE